METRGTYHGRLTLLHTAIKKHLKKNSCRGKKCLHFAWIRAAVFVAIAESVESDNGPAGIAAQTTFVHISEVQVTGYRGRQSSFNYGCISAALKT